MHTGRIARAANVSGKSSSGFEPLLYEREVMSDVLLSGLVVVVAR
ncbi:MAG: hypothetical protein ABSD31_12875 [Candidatus Binataceae bacterium]|jgi:hypothetical protein